MKNLQTLYVLLLLALASFSTSLQPVLTGPNMAYLNTRVAFRCIAPDSSPPVTYWLVRGENDPVDTATDLEGDQPVPFFFKVTAETEGSYHCRATMGESTGVSNSIKLSVVTPALNTRVISEPFPPVVYEGSRLLLTCNVSQGSHLSYTWFFNKKEVTSPPSSFLHLTGNKLVMEKVTPGHAGYYSCMAWSSVLDIRRFSGSIEVQLIVKVYASKPRLSFSISKEGDRYHGNVTCLSARGSPPVNFSLSVDDIEVGSVTATGPLIAWFSVYIVPGLDMGVAQCRLTTEVQEVLSDPLTLVVVPVSGEVVVDVDYLYRADSKLAAARLSCLISKGTFPHVSWLLNDSVLPAETHEGSHLQPVPSHYAIADHRRTLLLTKLGPEESGYYRCKARDSYDDSAPWVESTAVLVTDRVHNSMSTATSSTTTPPKSPITTMEIITISFCCILFLMLVLCAGCAYKMFDHNRAHGHMTPSNLSSVAFPLSAPKSQSESGEDDSSSTDWDVHNQTMEITV